MSTPSYVIAPCFIFAVLIVWCRPCRRYRYLNC